MTPSYNCLNPSHSELNKEQTQHYSVNPPSNEYGESYLLPTGSLGSEIKVSIKYNDDANGWYLLPKLLPSSYISTFCVVIVYFTDMISKYTLFQAFYSLLIFFACDYLHSVSALQSTLWAMVKWTYRVLCMSIFTWFTEYSVKHPKIDLQITL